jgi:hypothetical protein
MEPRPPEETDFFIPSNPENFPRLSSLGKRENLTEEFRLLLAERGKRDLYFLCTVILGYVDLVPHVHGAMCRFVEMVEFYRRLMLMPRTHFKTTIWTIADTMRLILIDPNERILLIGDTAKNAERFMKEIQLHFEMNEVFRWVYREYIPNNFNTAWWNKTEMCVANRTVVAREPTVDAIGAQGGVESRHYTRIKADDLVTEKHIHSDVEMQSLIDWVGGMESLLVKITQPIDWVGSRKKKGDAYEHIISAFGTTDDGEEAETVEIGPFATKKGDLVIFTRDAREESGDPIFPENVTRRFLDRLQKADPERYWAQYGNSPKVSGLNTFDTAWNRYYTRLPDDTIVCAHEGQVLAKLDPWMMDRIVFFDPSKAEHQSSSKQAIIVAAKGSHPFRVILETHIGHFLADEAINILFDIEKRWKPTAYSIEYRGYQGTIKYWLNERAERENLPVLPVVEWPFQGDFRANWAKVEWIKGLQPLFRAGFMWLDKSMRELLEELEFYPNVKWDDGLDALSQGLSWWPFSIDELALSEKKKKEVEFLERAGIPLNPRFLEAAVGKEKVWSEKQFLASLGPTGYGTSFHA